jgi:uncharacterized protein (UPF0276 family)
MSQFKSIPRGAVGIGLHPKFYSDLEPGQGVDYLEIISENFIFEQPVPNHHLSRFAADFPIVLHGVSLNLLGAEPLDQDYLLKIKNLADRLDAPFFSDHLCWNQIGTAFLHDLLPTPYRHELIDHASERAKYVQDFVGRPFAIENLSSYVKFKESELSEIDFYAAIVEQSGCNYMLDINNVYVSSVNHDFSALEYVNRIDFSKVMQVHLAGHDSSKGNFIIDTHDRKIDQKVWDLYEFAWKKGGPFPTLIEWDENIPDLATVMLEVEKVRQVRR